MSFFFTNNNTYKDLQKQINRVEAIRLITGGVKVEPKKPINYNDYYSIKAHIYSNISYLDDLTKLIDSKKFDKLKEIEYRNKKRAIINEIKDNMEKLIEIYNKQKNKNEEIKQDGIITNDDIHKKMNGILKNPILETKIDFKSNNSYVIPIQSKKEPLTSEHLVQMEQIDDEYKLQDVILSEMSTGLDSLNELALQMNDELEIQNKMLIELDNKTDKSQGKLDRVNERVQDAIKILNSNRSSKICMYVICLILLLLICYGFYEIIKK